MLRPVFDRLPRLRYVHSPLYTFFSCSQGADEAGDAGVHSIRHLLLLLLLNDSIKPRNLLLHNSAHCLQYLLSCTTACQYG